MLCRKFELVPIKIVFFMNFLSCSKRMKHGSLSMLSDHPLSVNIIIVVL